MNTENINSVVIPEEEQLLIDKLKGVLDELIKYHKEKAKFSKEILDTLDITQRIHIMVFISCLNDTRCVIEALHALNHIDKKVFEDMMTLGGKKSLKRVEAEVMLKEIFKDDDLKDMFKKAFAF